MKKITRDIKQKSYFKITNIFKPIKMLLFLICWCREFEKERGKYEKREKGGLAPPEIASCSGERQRANFFGCGSTKRGNRREKKNLLLQ